MYVIAAHCAVTVSAAGIAQSSFRLGLGAARQQRKRRKNAMGGACGARRSGPPLDWLFRAAISDQGSKTTPPA